MKVRELGELEVLLDSSAPAEDVAAVKEAFNDAGLMATVRPSFERKGIGDFFPYGICCRGW